jgi:hypothetical protein
MLRPGAFAAQTPVPLLSSALGFLFISPVIGMLIVAECDNWAMEIT